MVQDDFPLRLTNERVWRTYLGGALLDALHGKKDSEDGHFPEEWILSVVRAINTDRGGKEEGLSKLASDASVSLKDLIEKDPGAYLGERHAAEFHGQTGVLIKLIDSAERLTVQVHPDREKAMALFHSPYGKTECWHILGGRRIDGRDPCVYLGFREGVTREKWKALFDAQDFEGMLGCMHRFEVRRGDTVLIEGGIPHAIGAGCFLAEIQEPTDYTIRVERTTPSGFRIDDLMCHQGLGFDRMFDCFHYEGLSREEVYNRWFIRPRVLEEQQGGEIVSLVGYRDSPFFKMDLLKAHGELAVPLKPVFSGLYILSGKGTLSANGREEPVLAGEQFFLPSRTNRFVLRSSPEAPMEALHCFGPKCD